MATLTDLSAGLNKINASIWRAETRIKEVGPEEPLVLMSQSLHKRQRQLQDEFNELAAEQFLDVCDYRLIPTSDSHFSVSAVSGVLRSFQELVTAVFDSVHSSTQKKRYRPSAETIQQTELDFAYAYPGSLGFALVMPNERLIGIESDLDSSIQIVFDLMQADNAEELAKYVESLGLAPIKKLSAWTETHVNYDLEAEIKWRRKEEIRSSVSMQRPELTRLAEILDSKSEEEEEPLTLDGTVVGLDVEVGTFHMTFPDGEEIRGKLADSFAGPTEIPHRYRATIKKLLATYYSTRQDEVHYILESLDELK